MNEHKAATHKRVNVTLPQETLRLIDRVAKRGNRSHFVNEAVRFYVREMGRARLRKQLQEGAIQRAERDLHLAKEWFPIENEIWQGRKKK